MHKVLYISHESVRAGGANNSFIDMVSAIKEKVDMYVVLPEQGGMQDLLEEMGITCYIVKLYRGYGRRDSLNRSSDQLDIKINYEAGLKIKEIIEKEKIELVHINSSICNAGAIGAIMAGVPYIWHVRETIEKTMDGAYCNLEMKKVLFNHANAVIAISKTVHDYLKEFYDINSHIIYNAINPARYLNDIESRNADKFSFLLAGLIIDFKGQWDVIKAVSFLCESKGYNIKLYIVGRHDGRFTWILEKYKEIHNVIDNIILLDPVEDLKELREKCYYSITSTNYEALGRVTVEAMYAANLVIGADTAGTAELIGDDKYGYAYRQGDWQSLANTIEKVISLDKKSKEQMMKDAQDFACKTFNLEQYENKVNSLYDSVLKNVQTKDEEILHYINNLYDKTINCYQENKVSQKTVVLADVEKKWSMREKTVDEKLKRLPDDFAIYGMGRLGQRLYDRLSKLGKKVSYVIDKNTYLLDEIMKVYTLESDERSVDCIIVTPIRDEQAIKDSLIENGYREVIGISELIGE